MADIEQQRTAFEAAMVAAGYDKPKRPWACSVVTGDYLWQRDQDRFIGFQLALASQAQVLDEPDQALLISMATCLNHGFGVLPADRQHAMLRDMRKLWDEVMGRGATTPRSVASATPQCWPPRRRRRASIMDKIQLNRADSLRVVNNEDASPDAKVIASFALAFFAVMEAADVIEKETAAIAHKLMRVAVREIDQAMEDR